MKKIFTIFVGLFAVSIAFGQDCTGGRYYTEIFSTLDSTMNTTYGIAPSGQSLEFDLWKPSGDAATDRPVIILAHGGSFIAGSKDDATIRALCRHFARMGYVAVSMEYRLLGLDSVFLSTNLEKTFLNHVYRAVHDQMALVRYFRKNHSEGNSLGINPNLIIVGGISAGALLSIHTTYMDDPAKLPALIDLGIDGGFYGASGNPGFSSVPQAVINYCGAIKDTLILEAGDQPFVSIHGTADDVVPYGTDYARPMPGVDLTLISGSGDMKKRADHIGVPNPLHTYYGAGHCEFWNTAAKIDTTTQFVQNFLEQQICVAHLYQEELSNKLYVATYPNPTNSVLNVDLGFTSHDVNLQIINAQGTVVWTKKLAAGTQQVSIQEFEKLATGVYWLKIDAGDRNNVQKIIRN